MAELHRAPVAPFGFLTERKYATPVRRVTFRGQTTLRRHPPGNRGSGMRAESGYPAMMHDWPASCTCCDREGDGMLILIIVLILLLGGGGGYYGHSRWGYGGGAGVGLGTILLILLVAYLLGIL